MATWEFGPAKDSTDDYADGTVVPRRIQDVLLDGRKVGYVELHMHRREGRDGTPDVSVGVTTVVYGPAPGGN